MVDIRSGLAKLKFRIPRTRCEPHGAHSVWVGDTNLAFPDRDANPLVQTQLGLAKPKFGIPRARCESYGAHLLWVCETWVLQSQNEMRTLWCTLILGLRNLGFAVPERDANPMVHIHSALAKPRFCSHRTRCDPYCAHSFWVGETQVLRSQNEMRTLWCTFILDFWTGET